MKAEQHYKDQEENKAKEFDSELDEYEDDGFVEVGTVEKK